MMNVPNSTNDSNTPIGGNEEASELTRAEQEVGYTSKLLVQSLFPYRKQDSKEVVSQNGPLTITMYSAAGLPYGKYPRLILAYILTEAVKRADLPEHEARRVPLGDSLNAFLRTMGLGTRGTGGSRGTITLIREQLKRLMGTVINVESVTSHAGGWDRTQGSNVTIAQSYDLWFHPEADQPAMQESYIELSPQFFKLLTDAPIPLDLTILRALDKPRAMDLYIWLTYKKYPLRKPATYSWGGLQALFGSAIPDSVDGRKNFKRLFRQSLDEVLAEWPSAGVELGSDGLTIQPGQPSIARRTPKRGQLNP